jgi:hypothetical protein
MVPRRSPSTVGWRRICPCSVSDVYVGRHDRRDESFVLVIEDIGTSECRVYDGTWGITVDSAALALDDLVALHVRFDNPQRRLAEVPWAPAGRARSRAPRRAPLLRAELPR